VVRHISGAIIIIIRQPSRPPHAKVLPQRPVQGVATLRACNIINIIGIIIIIIITPIDSRHVIIDPAGVG
jgi:hypothetical protein